MESVETDIREMLNGIESFQKSIIDTVYSIPKSSKKPDVKTIFKALVIDNALNMTSIV